MSAITTPAIASQATRLSPATTRAAVIVPGLPPRRLARPARMSAGMARMPAVTRETTARTRAVPAPDFDAAARGAFGVRPGVAGWGALGAGASGGGAGSDGDWPRCTEGGMLRVTVIGVHGSGSASGSGSGSYSGSGSGGATAGPRAVAPRGRRVGAGAGGGGGADWPGATSVSAVTSSSAGAAGGGAAPCPVTTRDAAAARFMSPVTTRGPRDPGRAGTWPSSSSAIAVA